MSIKPCKVCLFFLLIWVALFGTPLKSLFAQSLKIDPEAPTTPTPPQLNPGFFFNNTNGQANAIFNSSTMRYNSLRSFELNWQLRTSFSQGDAITKIQATRSFHEALAARTDRLVILINSMPYWASSSVDQTQVDPNDNVLYYETVPPLFYSDWDSLMRGIAAEVSTWNVGEVYYEVWNEPDLYFWNGTEEQLLELYRHTAEAIKSVDSTAKVGGFGMNGWTNSTTFTMPAFYGYFPDTTADALGTLSHLIDSCSVWGTPLDFISWHYFQYYPKPVEWAQTYYRNKLDNLGFNQTETLITEYNNVGGIRDSYWQPALFMELFDEFARSGVDAHAMAAYQDFYQDPISNSMGDMDRSAGEGWRNRSTALSCCWTFCRRMEK